MKLTRVFRMPILRRTCVLALAVTAIVVVIVGCAASTKWERSAKAPPILQQQDSSTFTLVNPIPRTGAPAWTGGAPSTLVPGSLGAPGATGVAKGFDPRPAVSSLVPPQSLPAPGEELWIIQRPDARRPAAQADARKDEEPGGGALMAKRTPDAQIQDLVPVPLKHTDVKASVSGYIATVDVIQQFHNPFAEKIEAVYVFPLPANAAVNEFVMTVGDRRIRGIIRDRQEAQRIYQEAKSQGYVASLLTQERPNIFTQSVANIEPGKQIDINIRYFNTLAYSDGWYEFVFPMVVGPRFNPPGMTDGVGAVGQGARGASGQKTEVTYLRPGKRSGHDIALAVKLDAGVAVESLRCVNHKVSVKRLDDRRAEVSLDPGDTIPNKDFVLRYKVAGEQVKSGLIAHKGERGGYFTLMLVPPESLKNLPRKPLEFVFTIDVSGSMSGQPIEQAKAAVRHAIASMRPEDTFQIVQFDSSAQQMSPQPLPATAENRQQAARYINNLSGGGGTMMLEGMRRSLQFPHDENRLRFVSFLTDGYIGNETEILGAMHGWLGPARVFSFGVGSSPNRYLLDHMAKMGNGATAYLSLNDDAKAVMADYFDRVSHPALTDLEIDFGGMQVTEVFPRKLPDLFVGRPVILTGKFTGNANGAIKVKGRVGNETHAFEIPVSQEQQAAMDTKALPAVWARMKIADLADEAAWNPNADLAGQVRQVALEYGLMSSYTAFVAVDSLRRTEGNHGTTIDVPVPVPAGVRYETTVQEAKKTPPPDVEQP
jgi:Ca-activated chloride channel family protein